MIDLGHIYGESGEPGNSELAHYVRERLPADYMVNDRDLRWLDECDAFLKGGLTNASVTLATKAALAANPRGHIDPFELLIDAGICDRRCEPLSGRLRLSLPFKLLVMNKRINDRREAREHD
jgi:hypothetical protein